MEMLMLKGTYLTFEKWQETLKRPGSSISLSLKDISTYQEPMLYGIKNRQNKRRIHIKYTIYYCIFYENVNIR